AGADSLTGGLGADSIDFGAGDNAADEVWYFNLNEGGVAGSASGADTVTGFEAGIDTFVFGGTAQTELDDIGGAGFQFAVNETADFTNTHEAALQDGFSDADLFDLGLVASAFNADGVTAGVNDDALLVAVGQTMSTVWYYAESDGNANAIGVSELTLLAQVDAVLTVDSFDLGII